MGGEWGVGASLAMENAPAKWRGVLSGIVQSGYCVGYLLAAVAARFILPAWGWRAMLYNIASVIGAMVFGQLSERLGRRYSILGALTLSLVAIPAWAFGGSLAILIIGACLLQAGVQGAWGIIPAHLNELSPDAARGLIPGLAYQLGILFAARTNSIEYRLSGRFGYSWALAGFEIANILVLATVVALGSERKGKSFLREEVGTREKIE